jgi:ribonuclease G
MNKRMLVERDRHQTRIALLEDERVAEIFLEDRGESSVVGGIYKGRVSRVLPGMQAAFVSVGLERDAFLYVADADPGGWRESNGANGGEAASEPSIDEILAPGQELLVQVRKEPRSRKGARVTAQIALPGRFVVLLPGSQHLGVSRRIEDDAERERLRGLLESIRPDDAGMIARTEAEGLGVEDMAADLEALKVAWAEVSARAADTRAPAPVHRDGEMLERVVRDIFREDVDEVRVDDAEVRDEIVEWLSKSHPERIERVKLDGEGRLFERFEIDKQIVAALNSRVWLRSGGYLVIHPTEALVAIDVNTGRFVGRNNLEDTIFHTNLEAVSEIVRQIRLRDLGGILVVDFIDMNEQAHRDEVLAALQKELAKDRSRTRVSGFSEFGLVEMTRKRSRSNLRSQLTEVCDCCSGSGRVRTVRAVCLDLRRVALRRLRYRQGGLALAVHPDVALALEHEQRAVLAEIEESCAGAVVLRPEADRRREHFDVVEL